MPESGIQPAEPLRLHIGGVIPLAGWKILNIQPGPCVDFIGDCTDLSQFANGSISEIYAAHVYEHLGYQGELPRALAEVYRVLRPGGSFKISVPDLDVLCRLFIHPQLNGEQRYHVMRVIFGGQIDPYDFHKVGLTQEILSAFLGRAGFRTATRIPSFGLFADTSDIKVFGVAISLNLDAVK